MGSVCGKDRAFFITSSGGINGWAMDVSIPQVRVDLYAIHNWGLLTGCAVSENGTALYTINNWYQYIETLSNTNMNFYALDAIGSSLLWAVEQGGTIIYTSNYLLGWAPQASGVSEDLREICIIDVLDAWALKFNGGEPYNTIDYFDNMVAVKEFSVMEEPAWN